MHVICEDVAYVSTMIVPIMEAIDVGSGAAWTRLWTFWAARTPPYRCNGRTKEAPQATPQVRVSVFHSRAPDRDPKYDSILQLHNQGFVISPEVPNDTTVTPTHGRDPTHKPDNWDTGQLFCLKFPYDYISGFSTVNQTYHHNTRIMWPDLVV